MNMSLKLSEQQLLLDQLARCYAIEPSQLHCLTDNPADGVYGFTQHDQTFVLKYTLPTVRTDSALQAQVDWINYLAQHDVPVSRPIPSPQGRLVEQLPFNNAFVSAVCYQHVPGERPAVPTLSAEEWQSWGQTLGKMHALSTQYTPPQPHAHIDHWNTSATRDRRTIPADQTLVIEKFDALQRYFQTLPQTSHVYGLIHNDLQANNLRLDNGRLWVIDFDGCEYNWFIFDLATSLYFTLWERPVAQSNAAFAAFVLENMLVGYAREYSIGAEWVERLPLCLKLIEINCYVAILAYNQVTVQSNPEALPPKHRALLSRYRYNIEQDVPYIESAYNPWAGD